MPAEPTAIATVPTAIKKHLGAKRQKNRSREIAFALDFCLELGFRANDEKNSENEITTKNPMKTCLDRPELDWALGKSNWV